MNLPTDAGKGDEICLDKTETSNKNNKLHLINKLVLQQVLIILVKHKQLLPTQSSGLNYGCLQGNTIDSNTLGPVARVLMQIFNRGCSYDRDNFNKQNMSLEQ